MIRDEAVEMVRRVLTQEERTRITDLVTPDKIRLLCEALADVLLRAVAGEREKCVKISLGFAPLEPGPDITEREEAALDIAAALRGSR